MRRGPFGVLRDMLSQASGIAIIAAVAVLFVGGAVVGTTMIGRLGGAGWIIRTFSGLSPKVPRRS